MENDSWEIIRDATIQTDHIIEVRRPDMVIIVRPKMSAKLLTLHAPLITELKRGRQIR